MEGCIDGPMYGRIDGAKDVWVEGTCIDGPRGRCVDGWMDRRVAVDGSVDERTDGFVDAQVENTGWNGCRIVAMMHEGED